jgi:hypothetical protein
MLFIIFVPRRMKWTWCCRPPGVFEGRAGLFDAETRLAIAGCMGSATSSRAWRERRRRRHVLLGRLTFSWGRRRMRFGTAKSLRAGRGKPASGGVRWLMADG